MKSLQYLGAVAARTGVLDDYDIVRPRPELFSALCYVQDEVGRYRELPLLQFSRARIYCICVAMNEKGTEAAASMRRGALQAHTSMTGTSFALSQR